MEKVLVIEDEAPLARLLELELEHEGYKVEVAHDGKLGLEKALDNDYDLILLDLLLPGMNGIEVCRRLRAVKSTPVIMLTARDTVIDRVNGLDSGADDYIGKPFAIEEVLARMRTVGRRLAAAEKERQKPLQALDLTLDVDSRTVTREGRVIDLSTREFDLLRCLLENKNRVLSRDFLLSEVWGFQYVGETNVVDVYIRYVRSKADDGFADKLIHTVRGAGYVLREQL